MSNVTEVSWDVDTDYNYVKDLADEYGTTVSGYLKHCALTKEVDLITIKDLVLKVEKLEKELKERGEREEIIMEKKYIGIVKDQLRYLGTHKTKSYSTYKEAHDAAEKLCKKTLGKRGIIDVKELNELKK